MPFPSSDRVIFERNPLAEVVCELRFPPILRIAAELPAEFQERIRRAYPVYQPPAAVNTLGPAMQTAPPFGSIGSVVNFGWQQQPSFVFTTESGSRTLTLTQESLSIAERDYRRWELLLEEIETAKRELESVYEPSFYTRLGLRYQDIIDRASLELNGVPWRELLTPGLAGLLGGEANVADDVVRITSVAELDVPGITNGRVRIQHGLIESPDPTHNVYAIDADFFCPERSELTNVRPVLETFNLHAGNFFRWAISDRLREALRPARLAEHDAA